MTGVADAVHLEERRRTAMLAGDATELNELVHRECVYIHSSGFVDSGGSMTDKIAAGVVRYERLDIDEQRVIEFADAVVIVYRQAAQISIAGEPHNSLTRCAAVWSRTQDGTTRLVSFQSGQLKAS